MNKSNNSNDKLSRRNINGVLLLDKPIGLTSNAALQQVKRLYQANKAGHTGSLDPLASGLLPICFGEATKLSSYLLDADKVYHFICQLGVITNTGDADGEVLDVRPVKPFASDQIRDVLRKFTGEIEQIPPMYSALKHKGKRLYELARQGITVERKPRVVMIYDIRLLNLTETTLECSVRSSKGMYVRTLAEDIGKVLECGAHIIAVRRSSVDPYQKPDMVTMEMLQQRLDDEGCHALDSFLLPADSALSRLPAVLLNRDAAYFVRTGHAVQVHPRPDQSRVRLYDPDNCFIGIGEMLADGRIAPRRLFTNTN